jgi:DNA adenine methylase
MMLRFPGGKTGILPLLRPYIDKLVDGRDEFHDVFVGSGVVLLDTARRHPSLKLYANDADAGLMTFWKIVSAKSVESFCNRIRSTKPTLKLFRDVLESRPTKKEDIAFRFYFLNRTSFSGLWRGGPIGGLTQRSRWKVGVEWRPEKSIKDIQEANRLLHGRLTLSCASGTEYVTQNLQQPLFVDPQYFERGDWLYAHKMTLADHFRLSRLLHDAQNWLLTLDDSPAVREFYSWACLHVIPARYQMDMARRRRARAQELVITPVSTIRSGRGLPTSATLNPLAHPAR